MRKIIHIDMDAFFASIEQRDRPGLRGLPVIVGGSAERRGVVSTCSYEARAFGVHSAMPMRTAQRLCPQAVYLEVDMKKYRNESARIREIFYSVTDLVEPVSIDEAYLDVTENKRSESSATRLARAVQREIFLKTGLTASAGVSYNKFLAKIASDLKKPAGLTVIPPERAMEFLDSLPVGKFHGIGKVSAAKLTGMNIRTGRLASSVFAASPTAISPISAPPQTGTCSESERVTVSKFSYLTLIVTVFPARFRACRRRATRRASCRSMIRSARTSVQSSARVIS